jgi:serine/threonine-protein kinase ATR
MVPTTDLQPNAKGLMFKHEVTEILRIYPELVPRDAAMTSSETATVEAVPSRSNKRRRLTEGAEVNAQQKIIRELTREVYKLLGSQPATDLAGLDHFAVWVPPPSSLAHVSPKALTSRRDCFKRLQGSDQCKAFSLLGTLVCANAGTLSSIPSITNVQKADFRCSICDSEMPMRSGGAIWPIDDSGIVYSMIENLLRSPDFHDSGKARICAMMMVRRLLIHSDDASRMCLASCPLGQWCLQSHYSSMRELRVASG